MNTHKMIAVKWPDKKWVTILTMRDNNGMVDTGKASRKTGKPVKKSKPVLNYNKGMGVCVCWGGGGAEWTSSLHPTPPMHHYLKA
jgi:hypothetical protein